MRGIIGGSVIIGGTGIIGIIDGNGIIGARGIICVIDVGHEGQRAVDPTGPPQRCCCALLLASNTEFRATPLLFIF